LCDTLTIRRDWQKLSHGGLPRPNRHSTLEMKSG